jgi:hypothetical protein
MTEQKGSFRYVTICTGNTEAHKVWGLEFVDWDLPVYITEGPIDAMSMDNMISIAGAANNRTIKWIQTQAKAEIIFCYDNDYSSNKDIMKQIVKRINEGFGVLIYDDRFKWKDFNAALTGGLSKDNLNKYIVERSFFDLQAKLNLSRIAH